MADVNQIATKGDIQELKRLIASMVQPQQQPKITSDWVCEDILVEQGYDSRTLKYYRDNRQVDFTKFGRKCFYSLKSINKLLEQKKTKAIV